jgi:hypothetical protein
MSTADERFLAAARDEGDGNISAGWRPGMGPRPEPTPEERAAFDAAMGEADRRFLAAARDEGDRGISAGWRPAAGDATLPDDLRRAADARPGEPVHVLDPATNRRFVLLPAEVYDRLVRPAG